MSHLEAITESIPPGIRLSELDYEMAKQLDTELEPHAMQSFENADQFLQLGFGYGALEGKNLVSAATTYAISHTQIELAIATRPSHRRRGLGRIVAAALMRRSIEAGLTPEWTAANPTSQGMARALGYRPGPICDVVILNDTPKWDG